VLVATLISKNWFSKHTYIYWMLYCILISCSIIDPGLKVSNSKSIESFLINSTRKISFSIQYRAVSPCLQGRVDDFSFFIQAREKKVVLRNILFRHIFLVFMDRRNRTVRSSKKHNFFLSSLK
jgi:hypothetical protein